MTCLRGDALVLHEYLLDPREGFVRRVNGK